MESTIPKHGGANIEAVSLDDYRDSAARSLPREVVDYIDGGAGDEVTRRANRHDFDRLTLLPLSMRDVSIVNTEIGVLTQQVRFPIGISPTALHGLVHPEGENATARAAKRLVVPMIVSAMSSVALEKVASQSGHNHLWLQTYIFKNQEVTKSLVVRAEHAGYKAIVVSLGCPVPGTRYRNLRNQFQLPRAVTPANFDRSDVVDFNNPIHSFAGAEIDPSATWRDIAWLRNTTDLPIIAKGLMNACDVTPVLELGLSGIIVSNHGGRQLDTTISTIKVLPEIVAAVAGQVPIFIDGGFRRGTDVLKALALGADCAFIGRPVIWALAVDGEAGVVSMLALLADELRVAMQLAGCPSIAEARMNAAHLLRWN